MDAPGRLGIWAAGALTLAACTLGTEVGKFEPAPGKSETLPPDAQAGGGGGAADVGLVEGGSPPPTKPISAGKALLRVLHVTATAPVDICLDAQPQSIGPLFGGIGISSGAQPFVNDGYFEVAAGTYTLRAVAAGLPCTQPAVASTPGTVTIADGERGTAIVHGNLLSSNGARGPTISLVRDDVTESGSDRRVRFVHAAPEFAGKLDLEWRPRVSSTYAVAFKDAPYGGVATPSQLASPSADGYLTTSFPPFTTELTLRVEGPSTPAGGGIRSVVNDVELPTQSNFTVIVVGDAAADPAFVICEDEDLRADSKNGKPCKLGFPH